MAQDKNTNMDFKIKGDFKPAGDQPKAIESLVNGIKKNLRHQTLVGVTGSGKTFTAANVISQINKPTLVIAHNKTLAAQLAQEYREFFPDNAVHYFVSYYDYYQPEAYIPVTDTFIEKEAQINKEIDRLRHASTQALLTRKDVIIVASVSCIYGLGSPEEYKKVHIKIERGEKMSRQDFLRKLISIHFERTNSDLTPGHFRALGTSVEIMPVNENLIYRLEIEDDSLGKIEIVDPVSRQIVRSVESFFLFPAKHFITAPEEKDRAIKSIKAELENQLAEFKKQGKLLEYERLKRRTNYDLAMIREVGYCSGIENYSRHFSGRNVGDAPDTLLSYFPHKVDGTPDFLTVIDESHVTVSQIDGMYAGDASRKQTLVEHGFRLPSAKDNRPLKFSEFEERVGQVIYTSATPGPYEKQHSENLVEQIIRPTGLIDPEISIFPAAARTGYPGQIKHFISEAEKVIKGGHRAIATTLTKKMAEDLSLFLKEKGIKSEYLHSDIKTLDRIELLTRFRRGEFDCLVGVNLLREGLDLPELAFIGILDADREGFLRSETSLIQIIGRAARNVLGHVFLYADKSTDAMVAAINETNRRREIQKAYNVKHGITPKTISKAIKDIVEHLRTEHEKTVEELVLLDKEIFAANPEKLMRKKEKEMNVAVKALDFETAAILRDEIRALEDRFGNKKKIKPNS